MDYIVDGRGGYIYVGDEYENKSGRVYKVKRILSNRYPIWAEFNGTTGPGVAHLGIADILAMKRVADGLGRKSSKTVLTPSGYQLIINPGYTTIPDWATTLNWFDDTHPAMSPPECTCDAKVLVSQGCQCGYADWKRRHGKDYDSIQTKLMRGQK